MASPTLYTNGFGGSLGSTIATSKPTYQLNGGFAWFVNSNGGGADGASPAGKDRAKPLLTVGQAVTNAAAGDTIVCLSGHTQNLASVVTLNKAGLKVISEGSGSNAAKFTCASTGGCFTISAGGCELSGLYFPASTSTATNARVDVTTTAPALIENCYFEMGALDTTAAIRWGSGGASTGLVLDGVSWVANGATQAAIGLSVVTNASNDMDLYDLVCDGGSIGFSDYIIKLAVAVTRIDARGVDQLNNCHVSLAAGCTGTWIPGTVTGGSRLEQA